ncbi:MAG: sodium-extruding oxaloacetate decarboxylase subunit alpha [Pseudomonadales bacterium]|jgi:pyruvate carboxylase subunit B|nr:sodium-extruding oxaloacetate decarboxylase subunit alpha [Pseudomonadales bacterium]
MNPPAKPLGVTDLILRDAHQSLIATRMRTEDMLPICSELDAVGYWSLECWGGATFDACVRFLAEDPWERLRKLRAALPKTRTQMLLRGQNLLGYRHYGDDVVRAFVERSVANGMDVFRIFDALNDVRNLETAIAAVKSAGAHAQGTLCYTTSPVHGTETFVEMAKALVAMDCDTIAIKDMAGLLTPGASYDLVRALKQTVDLPVHFHSHATSGLAQMCQLKAVEAGADVIDTAISAFANGTSHPATEAMVAAFRGTERDTGLDLEQLRRIGLYFLNVREKYHQFESPFTKEDVAVQINQVPGGMMSNLANQLREQGALDRIQAVFEEIPRVREDLGYPPLVTPTSQIVGTQAVLNVIGGGERYATITNEVKRYLQGHYGAAPAAVNAELRQRAIGTEAPIDVRPADLIAPELDALREEIGELAQSEEDVLTYAMFPEVGRKFLEGRAAGTLEAEALLPPPSAGDAAPPSSVPTEFLIDVHGEQFRVNVTGVGLKGERKRHFYMTIDGVPEEVVFESLGEYAPDAASGGRPPATEEGDVTPTMPGNIVDVLVAEGDTVEAGQPVLIIEAMKMETELQAPVAGNVVSVNADKGDRVTPGEALIQIRA